MKKVIVLLGMLLLLSGCGGAVPETETTVPETTEASVVRFPDGAPETAACLGSYTADTVTDAVIARVGDAELTNAELQAWYWAEVAQYRQSGELGLDDHWPLDQQACPIDDTVATWQQYFLKQALNTWHTAQALVLQGQEEGAPLEEPTYNPTPGNYAKYMDGMPATSVLYGYAKTFQPNTMHQAYLDELPERFAELAEARGTTAAQLALTEFGTDEKSLTAFAETYNLAYMYFTSLSYVLDPGWEEIEAYLSENEDVISGDGELVTFRHILCTGEESSGSAYEILEKWRKTFPATESTFASKAFEHSQDQGSASKGGLYRRVAREQIPEGLVQWCFDPDRTPGDTTVVETKYGAHAVYFVESEDQQWLQAEQALLRELEEDLLVSARELYPISVTYEDITLKEAAGTLTKEVLLYPDLAHERFPEVPLYLQQDYPNVMYGGFPLRTNGCGITSFAMLASYMADEALTPPYMCEEYGRYSLNNGTDSGIFKREGAAVSCYLIYNTYNWEEAREYVAQGYPTIVLQHKGYWTRGGHYLVLEKMDEDGLVQVRDSNLYNYSRIRDGHLTDRFPWDRIWPASSGYWVFAKKDVTTPACTRCGTASGQELCSGYLCQKCEAAVLRRDVYFNGV